MCLFSFLIKLDDKRFRRMKSFQYLIFLLVILLILNHLGWCNDRKLQSVWTLDHIWWVYNAPCSFRENYKCPLLNLPCQILRLSNGHVEYTHVKVGKIEEPEILLKC